MKEIVNGIEDLKIFAKKFASNIKKGDIVFLNGDLGAGKTTFTSFVFAALGVKEPVTSPTFAIIKQYQSNLCELYHFDVYRIDSFEAIESGFDEIFTNTSDKIIFIEWSENISDILPTPTHIIDIKYLDDEKREFLIT